MDRADSVTTGNDAFGTSYTTTAFVDYKYGSLSAGEQNALRDAEFILIGASGANESKGLDIFGSNYLTTTTNTYTYYKGQVYVEHADTLNTGSDAFGSSYTTTSFVDYNYGAVTADQYGALRDAEFVLFGAYGESKNITKSIFGDVSTSATINHYVMVKGQALVGTAEVTTVGTNLFGEEYATLSTTAYNYYNDLSGPHGVYGEIGRAHV